MPSHCPKPSTRPDTAEVAGSRRAELLRDADDVDQAATATAAEAHHPVGRGEERVIAAAADVEPRVELGAPLPDDDRPRGDNLAAEPLDAQALSVGVAAVPGRRGALLLLHLRPHPFQLEVISIVE